MTERRIRAGLAAVVVAGLAAGSGGCVGQTGQHEPAEEQVADPQGLHEVLDYEHANAILVPLETWGFEEILSDLTLADLADGTVTEDEFQASFERYRSCLRNAGYELENIHANGPFIGYSTPAAAVESGVDDECFFSEYFAPLTIWESLNQAENERQNRIHRCVGEHGIDTSTASGHPMPLSDMEQLLVEAGIDPATC